MKIINKKLIIVSNRLPIGFIETANGYELKESGGSLATAINSFLGDKEAIARLGIDEIWWVGAANCTTKVWQENKHLLEKLPYKLKPIFMSKQLKAGFYDGFCHSTLWPLLLYTPSFAEYKQVWFEKYIEANELFFTKVNRIAQAGDIVWVHDYHLSPLPELLRQEHKNIGIGFFLHTPFPSFEIMRLLPIKWYTYILRGMLGADLIGFQTGDYVQHFERTIQQLLDKEQLGDVLNMTKIDKFPIGIDFEKYNSAFNKPEVKAFRENIQSKLAPARIIVSVDKLDYAKGIFQRLKGMDYFFEIYPEWQRHVIFILAVAPSPQDLTKYAELKKSVEMMVQQINGKYGTSEWFPIIYKYDFWDFDKIVGLYSAADIALITPMRDGMNIVAKEFIASRFDKKGVLILSDMSGAAQELHEAVLIHPTDTEDIAHKIRFALLMPPHEQELRMENLQKTVSKNNVQLWAEDFLSQLHKIKRDNGKSKVLMVDEKKKLVQKYKTSQKRLFLLDYDGTLVNFRLDPEAAKPSTQLLFLLKRLSKNRNNHIVIISGRNAANLEEWFGYLPITLVAEHGLSIKHRYSVEWDKRKNVPTKWKETIRPIIQECANRCHESILEEKDFSLAWHYRRLDSDTALLRSNQLVQELSTFTYKYKLEILHSKKVVEIRPQGVDKGVAALNLLAEEKYDFVLAIGDDSSDENMFSVLSDSEAYTIKVGQGDTCAKYRLLGSQWVIALLENIIGYNEKEANSAFFSSASSL